MKIDFPKRILDTLDNGILIINIDLEIFYWNRWLELHTKKKASELQGKKLSDIFVEIKTNALKRKIKTALALNTPSFYSSQTALPLFEIQRPHISNTIFRNMKQDITISSYDKDLGLVSINIVDQTKLFEANYKLRATADFQSQFLANMSHEIRTPMNAILGFIEQLAKNEVDQQRVEQFNIIRDSGQSLLTIINDILDLSKIESDEIELNIKTCDIEKIFEDIKLLYYDLAVQKGIDLSNTIDVSVPKYVRLDVMRIKQILFNLLSNAIKFTPEQGKIKVHLSFDSEKKHLLFSVTDNGIGIAQENINKIFRAFKQESRSTHENFGGTGLGLSISSKLVKLMQGDLRVVSTEGEGSCFSFYIPALLGNVNEVFQEDVIPIEATLPTSNILVVEDNKTNQLLMSVILDEFSQNYVIVNNGEEAIEMFLQDKYDLILMDENMPKMNGIEASLAIRTIEKERNSLAIPIVAVSANALSEDRTRFLQAGMNSSISKPYSEEDIKNILVEFLMSPIV